MPVHPVWDVRRRWGFRQTGLAAVLLMVAAGAGADELQRIPVRVADVGDLTELSLEDLLNIEVTSVSRRAEPLAEAAAAIYVLSGEEIQRSGARSIAEALRLVPGLFVARIGDINTHVITSRGFADRLSDKLEVVMDGRTVYTPLFSGVFWDTLDTFLPDIERIEVIRGPGATLWGPNAINGVINITTKKTADTRGSLFNAGAGTEERSAAGLRSGSALGDTADVRIYAKQFERDSLKDVNGQDTFTVARMQQAGLRSDWRPAAGHSLTLSGDVYEGNREDIFEAPQRAGDVETSGANVLTRWTWQTGAASELSVQAYYDHSKRFIPTIVFRETRDIGDLDIQHRIALGERHTVIYGAGYRESHDVTGQPPLVFIFVPPTETLHFYSAFVQDQIKLWSGSELTLGSKVEHNDYTGWEFQPNARLGWRASDDWFTWGAVSRAARTPSRLDHDLATFTPANRVGNPDQKTEKLLAYEWGLRFFGSDRFTADLTGFYNDYDDVRSTEGGRFGNGVEGHTTGAELALAWKPVREFDLRWSYTYLDLNLRSGSDSTDTSTARNINRTSPEHQAGLRASWQLAQDRSLSGFLRYVSELNPTNGAVPAYTDLNLRAAWRPWKSFELALVGENLFDPQHGEFRTPVSYTEVERSGMVELNWAWD